MRVELQDVTFAYGGDDVVAAVSFALVEGGVTALIGPSGSGKSTLVALLAGLLTPAEGRILFGGSDVSGVPPERRGVGVVFQSYALFPHLAVRDNIAFGLTTGRGRLPRDEVAPRVRELAALCGLAALLDRRPAALSGGERQRVALARALAPRPALLLLDEPLSALDASLRRQLRAELAALLRRLGTTVLYVTHDQEEAMMLADRLVVLERGRVVQAGPPLELYRRPSHPFVASFLGEANLLPVAPSQVTAGPGGLRCLAELVAPAGDPATAFAPTGDPATVLARADDPATTLAPESGLAATPLTATAAVSVPAAAGGCLLIRPEDLVADERGTPALVLTARGVGAFDQVELRLADGTELRAHLPAGTAPAPGSTIRIAARRTHFLAGAD